MYMFKMKALPLMVQKVWHMLKFIDMYVKGHSLGGKIKIFGMNGNASSQGICMKIWKS